jgi:nicotinate-nucleotide pyrophosphorylase (carboxylating)
VAARFDACLQALDPAVRVQWHHADGDEVAAGEALCTIDGAARALTSAERSALNLLQTLSATATVTRRYVRAIAGASPNERGCTILDTRKTLPGLRQAQKYAVRVGGGRNHRLGLWDGILIKENHIAAAGSIAAALESARRLKSGVFVQVEVESLAELAEALEHAATDILLDDFGLAEMAAACGMAAGRAVLEVSGGVDLGSVRAIAATGVDRISVGALTKNVHAVDLSLRIAHVSR